MKPRVIAAVKTADNTCYLACIGGEQAITTCRELATRYHTIQDAEQAIKDYERQHPYYLREYEIIVLTNK